jgi:hypothetical protein
MTYPLAHKIIKRFPYTPAANSDIRDTFAKARRDAANQNFPVLDADPVPAGTAQWEKPDRSSW